MNVFKWLKRYKSNFIINGVIITIVFYPIQFLLDFLGNLFIQNVILISEILSNNYYTQIAKNNPNTFTDWISFFLIIIFLTLLFALISYLEISKNQLKQKFDKKINKQLPLSEEILLEEIKNTEEHLTKIQESLSKKDNSLYIMSFFLMILLFINYAWMKGVASENVNFRNDIIKISPWADETELKLIKSKWASMKNKNDYVSVTETIQNIKKKNNIE
jgi:hypothetical protein